MAVANRSPTLQMTRIVQNSPTYWRPALLWTPGSHMLAPPSAKCFRFVLGTVDANRRSMSTTIERSIGQLLRNDDKPCNCAISHA